MNKLGEKGIRSKETKQKMASETRQGKHEIAELKGEVERLQAQIAELQSGGGSAKKLEAELADVEDRIEEKSAEKKKHLPRSVLVQKKNPRVRRTLSRTQNPSRKSVQLRSRRRRLLTRMKTRNQSLPRNRAPRRSRRRRKPPVKEKRR